MESKAGFILALIGGIISALIGLIYMIFSGMVAAALSALSLGWIGGIGIVLMFIYLIFGVVTIIGAVKMNKPETCKTGGLLALIFGILSFNILSIIGGILGLVAAGK